MQSALFFFSFLIKVVALAGQPSISVTRTLHGLHKIWKTGELSEESERQWRRRCRNKLLANPCQTYQTSVTRGCRPAFCFARSLGTRNWKIFSETIFRLRCCICNVYGVSAYFFNGACTGVLAANMSPGPRGLNVRKMLIPTDRINLLLSKQGPQMRRDALSGDEVTHLSWSSVKTNKMWADVQALWHCGDPRQTDKAK